VALIFVGRYNTPMSLTQEDLLQIRNLVREEVTTVIEREIEPLRGEIQAWRNDIKDIYDMISQLEKRSAGFDKSFERLSDEQQIMQLYAAVTALAKRKGVTLPR
jgi:uncharacterized protein (UPF0335 family)